MAFASLDFVYVPAADVDAAAAFYTGVLGGELRWRVRGMGTSVACVQLDGDGPAFLLSGHLDPGPPVMVHRVDDYAAAMAALRAGGASDLHELEIPHGPCASFTLPDGQRAAVYQLVRPEAATYFDGRFDE
ncbi:MAG TPA: VOC family protein [Acidimicrobiales bacterium]|nr:VOC family protein [Acidimicrobiales bacterium]